MNCGDIEENPEVLDQCYSKRSPQSPHSRQNALFKIPPTANLNTTLKHLPYPPYPHLKPNRHNQPHRTFKMLFYIINHSIKLFDIHTDLN